MAGDQASVDTFSENESPIRQRALGDNFGMTSGAKDSQQISVQEQNQPKTIEPYIDDVYSKNQTKQSSDSVGMHKGTNQ